MNYSYSFISTQNIFNFFMKLLNYEELHVFGLKNRVIILSIVKSEEGYPVRKKFVTLLHKGILSLHSISSFCAFLNKVTCSVHIKWNLVWSLRTRKLETYHESMEINFSEHYLEFLIQFEIYKQKQDSKTKNKEHFVNCLI